MASPQKKLCPFAAAQPNQENSDCLGENCACHVKLIKPNGIRVFGTEFADPERYLTYEGCGLVSIIPWELKTREASKQTEA